MKIKTSELIGPALDWAVAKCEGVNERDLKTLVADWVDDPGRPYLHCNNCPSQAWAQGGPIIEREEIEIGRYWNREPNHQAAWKAQCGTQISHCFGPTPLIAAMRCYCVSKLGDEVEIPEDLK